MRENGRNEVGLCYAGCVLFLSISLIAYITLTLIPYLLAHYHYILPTFTYNLSKYEYIPIEDNMNNPIALAAHQVIKRYSYRLDMCNDYTCILLAIALRKITLTNWTIHLFSAQGNKYQQALKQAVCLTSLPSGDFINIAIGEIQHLKGINSRAARRHLRLHWLVYLKYGSTIVRTSDRAFNRIFRLHQR